MTFDRYTDRSGRRWRVEQGGPLLADWAIQPGDMPEFQLVCEGIERSGFDAWKILRMRYGIIPTVPDASTPPALLSTRTEAQLREALGLTPEEVESHLAKVKDAWAEVLHSRPLTPKPKGKAGPGRPRKVRYDDEDVKTPVKTPEPAVIMPAPAAAVQSVEVMAPQPASPLAKALNIEEVTAEQITNEETAIAVARYFGFPPETFAYRLEASVRTSEMLWFARRLLDLKRLFDDPMSAGMARRAIVNEIVLRRVDDELLAATPGSERFDALQDAKRQAEERYEKQWSQLEELCPDARISARRMTLLPAFSTLFNAARQHWATKDTELIDGIFTALGIQVEMRTSLQTPDPRYRPGWVLAMKEAMKPEALSDPKWQLGVPQRLLKTLDDGVRKAVADAVEKGLWKHTDLESDGPDGQYPVLVDAVTALAPDEVAAIVAEEEIQEPKEAVELE